MGKGENLKPDYIVGFADGEGTFNLVRYPDKRVRPQFLLFNTNKEILEKIRKTLDLNCPIFEVVRVFDVIKRRKKCYRLQARSRDDILKVVNFFDKSPPIVKNREYAIFKRAYEDWIFKL